MSPDNENLNYDEGTEKVNTESTSTADRSSVVEVAASVDGVSKRSIVPLVYYANFISDVADRFILRATDNERDKMHVLRIAEARDFIEENYPLLLRAVGVSSVEAKILQETIWSAFLIGLVSDREGFQLIEANNKIQQFRSKKGNSAR